MNAQHSAFAAPRCAAAPCSGLRQPTTCALSRPLQSAVAGFAVSAAAAGLLCFSSPSAAAVISAPECFNGSGPGCDAEQSPLVRGLLENSRANKEKNARDTLEKYWEEGYKSYFGFEGKELAKQDDGTYKLERPKSMIGNALRALGWEPPQRATR
jgi:hypothetical protein